MQEGIRYQILGLDDKEADVEATINKKIQHTFSKIANISEIINATIHFKKHDREGNKRKYSITIRLECKKGMLRADTWAWDAVKATEDALHKLEKECVRWKEKTKTEYEKRKRAEKEMQ